MDLLRRAATGGVAGGVPHEAAPSFAFYGRHQVEEEFHLTAHALECQVLLYICCSGYYMCVLILLLMPGTASICCAGYYMCVLLVSVAQAKLCVCWY